MRVLLDATGISAKRAGAGRYIDGLLPALDAAGADLAVVCQRSDAQRYGGLAPQARIVAGPAAIGHHSARVSWEQGGLPVIADAVGADVIHAPQYTMSLHARQPVVVTIHDVTYASQPEVYERGRAAYYRAAARMAIEHAARIVVPSRATRDELVRLLGADPTRIDVAYHGVQLELFTPPTQADIDRVTTRLGIDAHRYVAFLGVLDARKNVPNLIRGWARAAAQLDDPPSLVLAGGAGWTDEVQDALRDVPPGLDVVLPGYLPFGDLPAFFGGATVVAYPSGGEGFGLPVLEAMACRAAVLTTDRLSLPEVGGNAVAYTEPDVDSIATALAALLADEGRRERLREAALARAGEFTWERSAHEHLDAYSRAAASVSSAT